MQREAAIEAAHKDVKPFVTWPGDIAAFREAGRFPFPFIGDYVPDGWTLEETYFVDSSGMGLDSEPALSFTRFLAIVGEHVGDGWALTEVGQFQVYVGRYRRAKCDCGKGEYCPQYGSAFNRTN
jgi:hypothetical protein